MVLAHMYTNGDLEVLLQLIAQRKQDDNKHGEASSG